MSLNLRFEMNSNAVFEVFRVTLLVRRGDAMHVRMVLALNIVQSILSIAVRVRNVR